MDVDYPMQSPLIAVSHQPVWRSSIFGPDGFALALIALVALMFWKLPTWLVVIECAAGGRLVRIAP